MKVQTKCFYYNNITNSNTIYMFNHYFYIDYSLDGVNGVGSRCMEAIYNPTTRNPFYNKLYLTILHKTFDTMIYLCEYKNQKILLHATWN